MLTWIIAGKFRALLAVLLSLGIGLSIGFLVGEWGGKIQGSQSTKLTVYEKTEKKREKNVKRKTEIRQLDDVDLIRRYCRSSVFDIPYDQCVRTVKYVE